MAKKAPHILVVDPPALTIPPARPDGREMQIHMGALYGLSVERVNNGDGTTTWIFRPKDTWP